MPTCGRGRSGPGTAAAIRPAIRRIGQIGCATRFRSRSLHDRKVPTGRALSDYEGGAKLCHPVRTPMQTIAVWLCLVVVLLQGGTLGGGLVLCVEPNGSMNFEASLTGERCGECPTSPRLGEAAEGRASSAPESCPCIDIAVDSCLDRRQSSKTPPPAPAGRHCDGPADALRVGLRARSAREVRAAIRGVPRLALAARRRRRPPRLAAEACRRSLAPQPRAAR